MRCGLDCSPGDLLLEKCVRAHAIWGSSSGSRSSSNGIEYKEGCRVERQSRRLECDMAKKEEKA